MSELGYRCRECGKRGMGVIDTRPYGAYGTVRRRKCKCGAKVKTYEISEHEFSVLKNSNKTGEIKKARDIAADFVKIMDELFKESEDG